MKNWNSRLYAPLLIGGCSLLSSHTLADTVLGIYAGAGSWDVSLDGSMGIDDVPITTDELGLETDKSSFFYVALEHPIPLIPNIRIQRATLKSEGFAVVDREFTWDEISFPASAPTTTLLDFNQTDLTLYYEILDNWVSMDVGITAKILDGQASIESEPEGAEPIEEITELNGGLPMIYGMARFDIPTTGAYVAGMINYISYDNSTISDIEIKAGWMFESALDIGAEFGYRQFKMTLVDFEGANADLTYDGPYFNLALHF
ncbi:TIGR04219 family outer membrane beta-barrel protein [Teredinibacter purpureus]|uniref:TIGR04219 family outer membrane beta-barrel protein n=1 Tax=Teredinibacter purpureus TaxID=2731756 RepID=UPI0005F893D6|nr:TIGR04219 family outer membrane beta-barrel protein [Teredinibacter purpureus]